MTATGAATGIRQVYFHDPAAPAATIVAPSAFAAVRRDDGRLLLVRRCDSGSWELPGGRVDIGETATQAAVRETAEEAGVRIRVTGLVGVFSDPGHVIRSRDGEVRQQFALVFRGTALDGVPHADLHETSTAAWVPVDELPALPVEPPIRLWIAAAVAAEDAPRIA